MKSFIVLAVLVAAALAAPLDSVIVTNDGQAQILRYESDRDDNVQGYNYVYETSNGIEHQEEGQVVNPSAENPFMVVRGSFKYLGSNGVIYTVTYTADENGFHPAGDHLPVA